MTAEEEADLRALGNDLAGAMHSPWEPACIARAFLSTGPRPTFILTMQAWINLEAVRSPVLLGEPPPTLDAFEAALQAFGYDAPVSLTPAEAAALAELMVQAVVDGSDTALRMLPPDGPAPGSAQDGFGSWLPIYTCLVSQIGLSPADALAMTRAQAFALIAAHRRNAGWQVAGIPYALRDTVQPPENPQSPQNQNPQN